MTTEFESELERLFVDTEIDLAPEEFTARLMIELREPRRRERLIWSASCVLALVFSWLLFPALDPTLRIVAAYPGELLDVVAESLGALARSPLTYIYGAVLVPYLLQYLARRFQILFL
jgi:hypothetical protein